MSTKNYSRTIVLEGAIGAGKTTLCKGIYEQQIQFLQQSKSAKALWAQTFLDSKTTAKETEEHKDSQPSMLWSVRFEFMPRSLLRQFTEHPKETSLALQSFSAPHRAMAFYHEWWKLMLIQSLNAPLPVGVLMDRGIIGDSLFLCTNKAIGQCSDVEYEIYCEEMSHPDIQQLYWYPNIETIFLNVPFHACETRLRQRGTVDQDTPASYLEFIHVAHQIGAWWMMSAQCRTCFPSSYRHAPTVYCAHPTSKNSNFIDASTLQPFLTDDRFVQLKNNTITAAYEDGLTHDTKCSTSTCTKTWKETEIQEFLQSQLHNHDTCIYQWLTQYGSQTSADVKLNSPYTVTFIARLVQLLDQVWHRFPSSTKGTSTSSTSATTASSSTSSTTATTESTSSATTVSSSSSTSTASSCPWMHV